MKSVTLKYILTVVILSGLIGHIDVKAYNPVIRPELSNLCARAVTQDSYGYIWIATANGLCKSFGDEYEIYFGELDDVSTVPSNSVLNLYTDSDGWMMVATNLGVCGLERGTKIFHRFPTDNNSNNFGTYGFVEYAGMLLCYGDNGLFEVDKAKKKLIHRLKVEGEYINSAVEGPDGLLWLSNGTSMIGVDRTLRQVTSLRFAAADRVNAIASSGRDLLLGTMHGLMRFDPDDQSMSITAIGPDVEVKHITAANDSTMLIATGNRGVMAYNFSSDKTSRKYANIDFDELKSTEINHAYCDKSGNVWVSTFDRGEVLMTGRQKLFNADRDQLAPLRNDFVTRAVFDTYGNMWVGTRSHGIGVIDKNSPDLKYFNSHTAGVFNSYTHDFIQELKFDSKGRLWLGYNNSLIVCKPVFDSRQGVAGIQTVKIFPRFMSVVNIAEDSLGQMWIGTGDSGLFIIDSELNITKNISAPQLRSINITKILPYDDRHMLISAYADNLYLVNINNLSIRNFEINNTLASTNAIDMLIDKDHNLWIGTYHHGLFRIDGVTGNAKACINNNSYYDIVALAIDNQGDIWASSSYGIYNFNKDGDLVNSYLKANGLGGNQFHEKCVATKPDGKLLFGGNSGLEEIEPKATPGLQAPHIHLATRRLLTLPDYAPALKGDMAMLDEAAIENLEISYKENSISIRFFAFNYDNLNNIEFAYMLKGHDKDFIYLGSHPSISYSDLSPGDYEFYVKARHKGMDWQEPDKLLSICVTPNPWLSTPAYITYVLIFFSLIFAANRAYLRVKLIKQKYELSEERIRQEKALTANRIHFFTNISHELRTPLTLICGPAKNLRSNYKSMSDSEIQQSFDFINCNVERLLTLINQLLSFRRVSSQTLPLKVSRADIATQLASLTDLYNVYASENSVKIALRKPSDEHIMLTYDKDKVEKIVSNLIVNAIKYSNDKGLVTITLEIVKHPEGFDNDNNFTYACISVADNGNGIAQADIPKIFLPFKRLLNFDNVKKTEGFGIGLNFVDHLVKEHKGRIITSKNADGGMTFKVIIPACDEAFDKSEFKEINNEILPSWQTVPVRLHDDSENANAETEAEETLPKILIVEDNNELNTFLAGLFGSSYAICQATDGSEGLKMAAEECPDIIISDIRMPGDVDGYALCRQIKSDPTTSHIPVVLLTAKTLDENKIEGYKSGADAYLCKPFSPDVLKACVDNLNTKRLQQATLILASAGLSDQPVAQPQMAADISPLDKKFLEKLYAYIEDNLDNCDLNVNMLGRELGFSRTNFYRKVKALTGISPTDLLRVYRLNRAAELLLTREFTVGEVGEKIGFGSQSHFSSLFKKHFGVSPRTYVSNHFSIPVEA